jgi:hypothetical protein
MQRGVVSGIALACLVFARLCAFGESCQIATDMDEATRSGLTSAGQHYFDMVAGADVAGLRQSAIPSVAADFSAIESTVQGSQAQLAGSKGSPRPPFLLDASGTAPIERAEFFCGVFGTNGQTSNSAVFVLTNLPPGKYGVVIVDATSAKVPTAVSFIVQQVGNDWKLGGLQIKSLQLAGHDSDWFVARAREYKAKGQKLNAWLYYLAARRVISPLQFMSTLATDKLYDESKPLMPPDMPAEGKTAELLVGSVAYKLTDIFPDAVGADLDLVVKYQAKDISNIAQTYQANVAVMKALAAKFPEVRDAFAGIVARAVEARGRDYGTLLAMKDIK